MKKPTTSTVKSSTNAKIEQPVVAEAESKTIVATPKPPKKQSAAAVKTAAEPNAEQAAASATEKAKSGQAASKQAAPKKPKAATKPAVATADIPVSERVGLTAGSVWHFLDQNGPTPVAKLVKALTEEEKIIQRSIGWLAQEGKITLETIDKVETIALKA